mgnify:CR=1 FL=1
MRHVYCCVVGVAVYRVIDRFIGSLIGRVMDGSADAIRMMWATAISSVYLSVKALFKGSTPLGRTHGTTVNGTTVKCGGLFNE